MWVNDEDLCATTTRKWLCNCLVTISKVKGVVVDPKDWRVDVPVSRSALEGVRSLQVLWIRRTSSGVTCQLIVGCFPCGGTVVGGRVPPLERSKPSRSSFRFGLGLEGEWKPWYHEVCFMSSECRNLPKES